MNNEMNNLKKSALKMISTFFENKEEFLRFKCLVHIPAKRFEPTILIYLLFNSSSFYIFISKEIEDEFVKFYKEFYDFYFGQIYPELSDDIKKDLKNFPLPVESLNITSLSNDDFSDIEIFKAKFNSFLENLSSFYQSSEIIVDITGGRKIHSIVASNLASLNHYAYCYLMVEENRKENSISAMAGTEKIYIQYPDVNKISYLSIHSFPIVTIFEKQISCFYSGKTIWSDFNFTENDIKNIKNQFSRFCDYMSVYSQNGLESMLSIDYEKLKSILINHFDNQFMKELENYLNSCNIIGISLSNKYWNFPFEFIFNDFDDILIFRYIPKIDYVLSTKENRLDKNKNDKIKILLAILSNEKYMVEQYNELVKFFSEFNDIEILETNFKNKEEFLNLFSNSDIAHIIGHGTVENSNQYLIFENLDKLKISQVDFRNVKSPDFIFVSSCSSLTLNIDWDKTIYYEFMKNGCKTIIGTHWVVPTIQSLKVSKLFYENFLSRQPVGMALHNALKEINNKFLSKNFYFIGNHTARII